MAKYLLDTDICISMFKDKHGVREKIMDVSPKRCFVSEITIAELFYGAAKSGREEHFEDVDHVIKLFKVLPVYPALNFYGRLKADLERKGQRLDDFDLLIASTAIVNNMVMVTSNSRHFGRIEDIVLEDWRKL